MATLSINDRNGVWRDYMERLGNERQLAPLLKGDLKAAVDALDDFLNTNAGAINAAIPQPARASLTAAQKALLLVFVIQRRYLSGA